MTRSDHREQCLESKAARRAWLAWKAVNPIPAKGHMPFKRHRTIAEVDEKEGV